MKKTVQLEKSEITIILSCLQYAADNLMVTYESAPPKDKESLLDSIAKIRVMELKFKHL